MNTVRAVRAWLPQSPPAAPVNYSARLVSLVAVVTALAVGLAGAMVRPYRDPATLVVGSLALILLARLAVPTIGSSRANFSIGNFLHLGLSLIAGPAGAACAAFADAAGFWVRTKPGWFRTMFNVSNHFLCNMAAWSVFTKTAEMWGHSVAGGILGGFLAGLSQWLVNYALLASVIWFDTPAGFSPMGFFRRSLSVAVYFLGYGLSGYGFVRLHADLGWPGFFLMLVPVIMLQGFLVVLAKRIQQHEAETRAHQEARVRLLQQSIDASNTERERIAASIHDGVVQDLAGMAFSLGAFSNFDPDNLTEEDKKAISQLLKDGAETARNAARDLRTLMVEIAPPKLRELGLKPALTDLINSCSPEASTNLEFDSALHLTPSQEGLIYRVAQEAVRNIVKYAQAKNVSIGVTQQGDDLLLIVKDDGKGFSADDRHRRQEQGHVGLGLLQRTVEDGGGTLDVSSEPGSGTTVTMRIPSHEPPKENEAA